jgi:hypothetical protein
MGARGKKSSSLDKRIKQVKKELSAVDSNIKALSKSVDRRKGHTTVRGDKQTGSTTPAAGARAGKKTAEAHVKEVRYQPQRIYDQRFADYLASSFQTVRPLRHERRVQRNKAIVMVLFVLLALFWVVYRFFL